MAKRKSKSKGPIFRPCGKCYGGHMRITKRDGTTAMRECECLRMFKGQQPSSVVDGKARAANG